MSSLSKHNCDVGVVNYVKRSSQVPFLSEGNTEELETCFNPVWQTGVSSKQQAVDCHLLW